MELCVYCTRTFCLGTLARFLEAQPEFVLRDLARRLSGGPENESRMTVCAQEKGIGLTPTAFCALVGLAVARVCGYSLPICATYRHSFVGFAFLDPNVNESNATLTVAAVAEFLQLRIHAPLTFAHREPVMCAQPRAYPHTLTRLVVARVPTNDTHTPP